MPLSTRAIAFTILFQWLLRHGIHNSALLIAILLFTPFQTHCSSDADSSSDSDSDSDGDSDADSSFDFEGDDDTDDDDLFSVDVSLSPKIGTVGIVEWSIDKDVNEAFVEFGREDGEFDQIAPVDLDEEGYRTLLLGMKPSTTYYFRIVANGTDTYTSAVFEVETEPQRNGLPRLSIEQDSDKVWGGFTVTCTGAGTGVPGDEAPPSAWALIFDKDGDYVWWYELTGEAAGCTRARMSYDGMHLWVGNFSNVDTNGMLMRVTMDGMSDETYSLPGRHHDFSVLPNNNIVYYEQENGGGYGSDNKEGPDIVMELDPESGATTEIYHENEDFAQQISESGAHTNYIAYVPHLDALSISLRHTFTIGVISYPEGELLEVFGGPVSDYDISWNSQHGHQILESGVLLFNNNGTNNGASVLEYETNGSVADLVFDYSSGTASLTFGDVRRLPNGNTFVVYSNTGVIHEVDPDGELLREIITDSIGYAVHRKSLYGPPPPFAN